MDLATRLNATVGGAPGRPVLVLLHGFGCGQQMWRHVAPDLETDHRVVLLDLPGSGGADPAAYDPVRHQDLGGYAEDLLALLRELDLGPVTLVGHSVSAMIGVLAHNADPDLVERLVLVAPSARYLDDEGYLGGFTEADVADLLALMERNHLGWQDPLSAMVAGDGNDGARAELEAAFCRTDPEVAAQFARVTFLGDNRADLDRVSAPTLVLQVREDIIAPMSAGTLVHERVAGSSLVVLETTGHCPQLSAPGATVAAVRSFLAGA